MTYRVKKLCRTLAVFLLSVLVLSLLVFVIARLAPGDPLVSYYGERAEKMKPAERAQAEARLGLDQPIAQQYLIWLKGALRGEFLRFGDTLERMRQRLDQATGELDTATARSRAITRRLNELEDLSPEKDGGGR